MRGRNGYRYQARPVVIDGVRYDSQLEGRMAELLIAHGIEFDPHVEFQCYDREGKPFKYTADFVFAVPQKFAGISYTLDAIEVKGVLSKHALLRNDALKYCWNIRCYCAGYELIDFWSREGLHW